MVPNWKNATTRVNISVHQKIPEGNFFKKQNSLDNLAVARIKIYYSKNW